MEDSTFKLHTFNPLQRTPYNRLFATLYIFALAIFFYHHILNLVATKTTVLISFLLLLLADVILAVQWATATLGYRIYPISRRQLPENLEKIGVVAGNVPNLDIFICTADPYKEPPMVVVNTMLSVMAYDYPTEKLSVYVSDDGGSQLTLFAIMEAARFARFWLPFCKEKRIQVRSPEVYFKDNYINRYETNKIKKLYEDMKMRVDDVMKNGEVGEEDSDRHRQIYSRWNRNFTGRDDHPSVIEVLLDKNESKDEDGCAMPSLIYVSRGKSEAIPHNFKAGALNALIRVSAIMTNAPIILTLDCDMWSNDPSTIWRALCYFSDPKTRPTLAFVQFPQIFTGINNDDIYASEYKRMFHINLLGLDGLCGPNYLGTNCFLQRRAFFGRPLNLVDPEIPELSPSHLVEKSLGSPEVLTLAHHVADANYEPGTLWGSKMGMRYGSLVEDYFTGFKLHCEGWKSIVCHPERPAFFGGSPSTLFDTLTQLKRWTIGSLDALFSKSDSIIYGIRPMGLLMGLGYAHLALFSFWWVPLLVYAFFPQLALLNGISIFPKAYDPWCLLYIFLFMGAYGQDLLEFLLAKSTFKRWLNYQRMWMIYGLSSFIFGSMEYLLAHLGISTSCFNVTSKGVQDNDLKRRYDQGFYEFGLHSPMFVLISMATIVNLFAFVAGCIWISIGLEGLELQMLICGFVVVNSWPVYEAIMLRKDSGRLPYKTTKISVFGVVVFCVLGSTFLKIM